MLLTYSAEGEWKPKPSEKNKKNINTWRFNNMLPNNKWVTKDSKEIKMILGDKWKQNHSYPKSIETKKQF